MTDAIKKKIESVPARFSCFSTQTADELLPTLSGQFFFSCASVHQNKPKDLSHRKGGTVCLFFLNVGHCTVLLPNKFG